MCQSSIQHFILLVVICLETPKVGSGPANWWTVPSFVISSVVSFLGDPEESHRMVGGNVIQCFLAPLHQWRHCFGSLKSFHNHLTMRTNTNVFFWSVIHLNFVSTFCILHQCIFYFEMYNIYMLCNSHTSSFLFPEGLLDNGSLVKTCGR